MSNRNTFLKYLMLPKEKTASELQHVTRINRIALYVCIAHLPLFVLVAALCGTSILQAIGFGGLFILGPAIGNATLKNPRHLSLLFGFTAMGLSALLAHLGQGPMQIEMHFHVFAALALLAIWGNPLVIWVATLTVVVHHATFWFFIPSSVFNYEASFWVVLVHGAFVAAESIAAAFIARSFFDNVIGLEKIIEIKTETIRNILDNVSFGLFICDENLKLKEGYSRSSERIFKRTSKDMNGAFLPELLMLSDREASHLRALYTQIYEDIAPEDLSLGQLPNRFNVHGKNISLDGSVLRDAAGGVEKILFCIADITALVAAEAEVKEARTLLKVLKSKERFQSFVDESILRFERMREALANQDQLAIRRSLHTMKGNLGIYGLIDMANLIHQLEDRPEIEEFDLNLFESIFKNFLVKHQKSLGIQYGAPREVAFTLAEQTLETAEQQAAQATNLVVLKKDLHEFYGRIRMKPATVYLGPIEELCTQLAKRFGKKIKFEFTGGNTLVPSTLIGLMENIPHLLRNAIDHGVEQGRDRGPKPKEGHINLDLSEDDDQWTVQVIDDGRGINGKLLGERALELGKITKGDLEAMNDQERMALVFLVDVSTAETVTDISGRGIGMSAIAEAVLQLNGVIDIQSRLQVGTTVTIRIPKVNGADHERRRA